MDVTKQSSLIDFHGKRKVGDSDWNPSKGYEDANESAKRNATHKAETKRRRKRLLQFGIQKFTR